MPDIVIADTSFLIAIDRMELFGEIQALYKNIFITRKIAEEFQLDLPDCILIEEPQNIEIQTVLSLTLDTGEASAIALA